MPRISIQTNLKNEELPDDFEDKVVEKMAEALECPSEIIYVTISTGNRMVHNGQKTPMISGDIEAVGKFNEKTNDHYTKVFFNFFSQLLNLPNSRIILRYNSPNLYEFGAVRKAPEYKHAEYYLGPKDM